jgi:hypothetical protein
MMPCDTIRTLTPVQKAGHIEALKRLEKALALGTVRVVIGTQGAVAFNGWTDRAGLSDVCAYRRLIGSAELRRAVARAEVISGRKVDARAVAAGHHSHDGGTTWGQH